MAEVLGHSGLNTSRVVGSQRSSAVTGVDEYRGAPQRLGHPQVGAMIAHYPAARQIDAQRCGGLSRHARAWLVTLAPREITPHPHLVWIGMVGAVVERVEA